MASEDRWWEDPVVEEKIEPNVVPEVEEVESEEDSEVFPPLVYRPLSGTELENIESEVLKHIKLGKSLGIGSFGQVQEATALYRPDPQVPWNWLGRRSRFAAKSLWVSDDVPLNTVRELQVLPYISHDNVCNMAATLVFPDPLNEDQRTICIFLEFCHGTLKKLVDQVGMPRILPENLSRHWFAQSMSALQYVHGMNIAHLDIKDDNILYRSYEDPSIPFERRFMSATFKLTDFGIAESGECDERGGIENLKKQDLVNMYRILADSVIPKYYRYPLNDFITYCKTGVAKKMAPEWQQLSSALKDLCFKMHSINETVNTRDVIMTATDVLNHSWLQNKWHSIRRRDKKLVPKHNSVNI